MRAEEPRSATRNVHARSWRAGITTTTTAAVGVRATVRAPQVERIRCESSAPEMRNRSRTELRAAALRGGWATLIRIRAR